MMVCVGNAPEGAATSGPVDPVAGKTVAEILGEIVWLMTQDPVGREMNMAEIEALVMPAILAKRFHIKYAQVPDVRRPGRFTFQPVAVEIFAAQPPADEASETKQVMATFTVQVRGLQK